MRHLRSYFIVVLLAQAIAVHAGDRWNARSVGMGRTSVTLSRGTEAIGINPANVALADEGLFSLSLAPIGVRVSTDMLSYDIYQKYFTGIPGTNTNGKQDPKVLTEQDKQDLLASLPDGVATTKVDVEAMDFGATMTTSTMGGFGFAVVDHATGTLEVPKDFTRFFLYGLDSAGSQYSFDGASAAAAWWREINFSYAYQIPLRSDWLHNLAIGVGVKLLQGFGIFETDHYSTSMANQRVGANQYLLNAQFDYLARRAGADLFDPDKHVDVSMFPEPAGKGVGFDLGASAQIEPGLFVAASITDIGSIHWSKNLVKTDGHYALVMDDPFTSQNSDSLERAVRGINHPGDAFSSTLPATLRIGVALATDESGIFSFLPKKMLLGFDYTQGLNSSMGNVSQPRISLGLEYRVVSFLPLRTGFSIGGPDGTRWSAGFGLDFHYVRFDMATENFSMIFSKKIPQNLSIAAGLRVLI